jgi:hypothetical protein
LEHDAEMDPVIKRLVDAPAPLPPKALRMASLGMLGLFVGGLVYAKFVVPGQIEERIAKDMYSRKH